MLINTPKSFLYSLSNQIKQILFSSSDALAQQVRSWSKWLTPGISIKRWLAVNVVGILLISLGLSNLWQLILLNYPITSIAQVLLEIDRLFNNSLVGIIAVVVGLYLACWGQARSISSITKALNPEGHQKLVDILLCHHRLNRGHKIVALGGGTGLSSLLRGLKHHSRNLTAVVTVADDGGSSGRLREELGVLPPGDIRNCITALAKEESLLTQLFQYRFSAGGGLEGHSFGNLFLTAMSEVTGNLETAIAASSKILAVQGQVLPATLSNVDLWAKLDGGQIVRGESKIAATKGKIDKIGCLPANPKALPAALKAIESADCIVLGPGSLYTSIIPNLLVPEIRQAISKAKVPCIYVCNIMTQPGETDGYSVADHIEAIDRACGEKLFDAVLVNKTAPSDAAVAQYDRENSHVVALDLERIKATGRQVILADILDENPQTHHIRHHSPKVAQELNSLVSQMNSNKRNQPLKLNLNNRDISNYLIPQSVVSTAGE
ncbi:YvcK family protein [Waterburya agarophytonicola K14]|uniref:Putative gluconeogenesis factor n=1 Tax=Waterburya agarophytonicola KI4 TaxID=2874699 RepID=A0A964BXE0_9CYAN|nr:gluconeogenesis factor YvcK family protein [Waterburya agarophytonicola]MCC0179402.1 YvcK family protein [Waterburya agarophytonicola KI4]